MESQQFRLLLLLLSLLLSVALVTPTTSSVQYASEESRKKISALLSSSQPYLVHLSVQLPETLNEVLERVNQRTQIFVDRRNLLFNSNYLLVQKRNKQLLFVKPYAKFFMFPKWTQFFKYSTVSLHESGTRQLVANVSAHLSNPNIIRDLASPLAHSFTQQLTRELTGSRGGGGGSGSGSGSGGSSGGSGGSGSGSGGTTESPYALCYSASSFDQGRNGGLYNDLDTEYAAAYSQNLVYYCCSYEPVEDFEFQDSPTGYNDSTVLQCKYTTEGNIFSMIQFVLHITRLVLVAAIIQYLSKNLRIAQASSMLLGHVTSWYEIPPIYIGSWIPFLNPLLYSTKWYILFHVLMLHLFIYGLVVVHCFIPTSWSDQSSIISGNDAVNSIFYYLLFLWLIIVSTIFSVVKALTNKARIKVGHTDSSSDFTTVDDNRNTNNKQQQQFGQQEQHLTYSGNQQAPVSRWWTFWKQMCCNFHAFEKPIRFLLVGLVALLCTVACIILIEMVGLLRRTLSHYLVTLTFCFFGVLFHLLLTKAKSWATAIEKIVMCCSCRWSSPQSDVSTLPLVANVDPMMIKETIDDLNTLEREEEEDDLVQESQHEYKPFIPKQEQTQAPPTQREDVLQPQTLQQQLQYPEFQLPSAQQQQQQQSEPQQQLLSPEQQQPSSQQQPESQQQPSSQQTRSTNLFNGITGINQLRELGTKFKTRISYATLYCKYMIPTWLFEFIWLSSLFILSYVCAAVITRFIWSSLLLFILDPVQLQTYLYLLSLLTTLWKFSSDLISPYAKLKAMLIKKKDSKTLLKLIKDNNNLTKLTREKVEEKQKKSKDEYAPKYSMLMPWKIFIRLCDLTNVEYLIRTVVIRMLLTLFILCIYFLGTVMLDVSSNMLSNVAVSSGKGSKGVPGIGKAISGSSGASGVLGILSAGIMPLIPKIVEFFSTPLSSLENAVLKSRFDDACKMLERESFERVTDANQIAALEERLGVSIKPQFAILSNIMNKREEEAMLQKESDIPMKDTLIK